MILEHTVMPQIFIWKSISLDIQKCVCFIKISLDADFASLYKV